MASSECSSTILFGQPLSPTGQAGDSPIEIEAAFYKQRAETVVARPGVTCAPVGWPPSAGSGANRGQEAAAGNWYVLRPYSDVVEDPGTAKLLIRTSIRNVGRAATTAILSLRRSSDSCFLRTQLLRQVHQFARDRTRRNRSRIIALKTYARDVPCTATLCAKLMQAYRQRHRLNH